jgi:molybdate transport system permease protein
MLSLSPLEQEALVLSFRVAVWASIVSLPPAIAVAWLLARKDFWGKLVVDGLVHLPLVIPPVVVGYCLLVILGRNGVIGSWLYDTFGLTFAFNWKGAAVAAGVMGFPLFVRSVRLSIEAIDTKLETAARTLGASAWKTFWTVSLPLMAPGILAGLLLAFARALSEFGATITFVANIPGQTRTLPIAIYSVLQAPGGDTAALRMVVLSTALAIIALATSEFMARRLRARLYGQS